jgi:pimeloyl-ACP methyl ester carboxylesterase
MGRGHDQHKRFAMHRDHLEFRVPIEGKAQKSNIERSALQHLYLICRENIAGTAVPMLAAPVRNIVLVHGAFVEGSGWKPVYDILVNEGYSVPVVQEPLTSLEEDVAATKRILDRQPGPCILVGHSYGGAVITEAGTDSHVAALVYIAAHAPEQGETEAANGKKFPNASKPLVKTPDGFVFLDPANFPADFAADLPREQAEFMAHAQMLTAAKVFTTPITNPAWKLKPSW